MGQDSGDFSIWGTHRHCFLIVFTHKGCGFLRCVSGGEENLLPMTHGLNNRDGSLVISGCGYLGKNLPITYQSKAFIVSTQYNQVAQTRNTEQLPGVPERIAQLDGENWN
jgi:hypothetical protein